MIDAIIQPIATRRPGRVLGASGPAPDWRQGGGGPPEAGAEAPRAPTELLGLAPLQEPDHKAHAHCKREKDHDGLQKAE
jgi:hypothetical protein